MALPLWAKNQPTMLPVRQTVTQTARHTQALFDGLHTLQRREPGIGIALVCLVGLVVLTHVLPLQLLIVPMLSFFLVMRGIKARSSSLLLGGGILGGLGGAFLLTAEPFCPASGDLASSLFLLVCALGMFSSCALSKLFTRSPQWWTLIPGGMMVLTSLSLIL
jgi:hypothetical protein